MSDLAKLFAKHFIARSDVMAQQRDDGSYSPCVKKDSSGEVISKQPFTRTSIEQHLSGDKTFGHYMINSKNECKFFCFDVDLQTNGVYWVEPDLRLVPESFTALELDDWYAKNKQGPFEIDPRQTWRIRSHPARDYLKRQFRSIAELLTSSIHSELGIGTFASYSGSKGIHVYGMTGLAPAADVQAAADMVLGQTDMFKLSKGKNVFVDKSGEYPNVEIERFPKQSEVESGHYGNLLRLDLGINRKAPKDPTFFLDQTLPHNTFAPHKNPAWLLENCNHPWTEYPNE